MSHMRNEFHNLKVPSNGAGASAETPESANPVPSWRRDKCKSLHEYGLAVTPVRSGVRGVIF